MRNVELIQKVTVVIILKNFVFVNLESFSASKLFLSSYKLLSWCLKFISFYNLLVFIIDFHSLKTSILLKLIISSLGSHKIVSFYRQRTRIIVFISFSPPIAPIRFSRHIFIFLNILQKFDFRNKTFLIH